MGDLAPGKPNITNEQMEALFYRISGAEVSSDNFSNVGVYARKVAIWLLKKSDNLSLSVGVIFCNKQDEDINFAMFKSGVKALLENQNGHYGLATFMKGMGSSRTLSITDEHHEGHVEKLTIALSEGVKPVVIFPTPKKEEIMSVRLSV